MSPARAPGAVKARDCLLSSRSHAPGPGESASRRITQRGRGLATKRASPKGVGGVCVGARVEKEECCQSLGQIGSWSKQAQSRETWTQASHTVPTRRTRELCTAKPSRASSSSERLRLQLSRASTTLSLHWRDGNYNHHHHAECMHLWTYRETRYHHLARPGPGLRGPGGAPQHQRGRLPKQDQSAEETALQLTGTSTLQAAPELQRPRLLHPSAATCGRGPAE